jgi:hypothetical protein
MEQLDSRELLLDTNMMYKLHDSAINNMGSLESFALPQPLHLAWTSSERHTIPRLRLNPFQYSESARGSQPPYGGIFLPNYFSSLVGRCRIMWKARSTLMTPMMLRRISFGNTLLTALSWVSWWPVEILRFEVTEEPKIWYDTSRRHAKYQKLRFIMPC